MRKRGANRVLAINSIDNDKRLEMRLGRHGALAYRFFYGIAGFYCEQDLKSK